MAEELRTRRQTRAALLARLLASGGLFRPQLAAECRLTEASISRIVAELREEGLVEESRRPTPYPGGPSQIVTLRNDQWVLGLDIANDRLTVGAGNFTGELGFLDRYPLAAPRDAASVRDVLARGVAALAAWCAQRQVTPWRVACSIPGFRDGSGPANPIVAVDAPSLEAALAAVLPGVPVVIANAIAAHAAAHLHASGAAPVERRQLFLHLGHGVGGAWLEPMVASDPIRPIEIGHVVLDVDGPPCRCGHQGCLEAIASTTAIAAMCGVAEAELIAAGDEWPRLAHLSRRRKAALRDVLFRVGVAVGNALNVMPVAVLALSGWPTALPDELRDAVAEGLDRSLFGGLGTSPVAVRFLRTALGGEPRAALAYAMHDLVRNGGMPSVARAMPHRIAG